MARLPVHVIDEVRARSDIVDVVSEYVPLQRSGRRFRGLCPFHPEKTPSFYVDREKQFYHCFGCQAGGDVFTFIREIEKVTFLEAVRRLAERAGMAPVEAEDDSPEASRRRREREACYAANEAAREFFVRALFSPEGEAARRYLKERGLDAETVKLFGIGYAPDAWRSLCDHLQRRGIPEEAGVRAGLLRRNERGTYDWFRGRIMFPITDPRGRVVGFGGRVISGDGVKYLNTAETPVFSKGSHLYGLDVVRRFRTIDEIVLVEGYMDVVGLYRHGYGPAVASLGTALTAAQARLVKRYARRVVVAYDADAAGRQATLRGLEILAEEGLEVRVARLPEGEDPDSFIRARGREAFEEAVCTALPFVEYRLEEALRGVDLERVEGRVEAVRRVLPVLAGVRSAVAQEGYVAMAAQRIGVSAAAIVEEMRRFEQGGAAAAGVPAPERRVSRPPEPGSRARHNLSRTRYTITDFRPVVQGRVGAGPAQAGGSGHGRQNGPGPHDAAPPVHPVETAILARVLREPERVESVKECLGVAPFGDPRYNEVFGWLCKHGEELARSGGVVGRIDDPDLARIAGEVLLRAETPVGPFEVYLERAVEEGVRRRMRWLEARLGALMRADSLERDEVDRLVWLYREGCNRLRRMRSRRAHEAGSRVLAESR